MSLPPGWVSGTDPKSGHIYYHQASTGTSSWTKPAWPRAPELDAPLRDACAAQEWARVDALLDAGAMPGNWDAWNDEYGNSSSLVLALDRGAPTRIVQRLLIAKADPCAMDMRSGLSALQLAVLNLRDDDDERRALEYTERTGTALAIVQLLADAGAELDTRIGENDGDTDDGQTAIHLAAQSVGGARVITCLAAAGAELDVVDEKCRTALHIAVGAERLKMQLARAAAVAMPGDASGGEAFVRVVENDHAAALHALIAAGAPLEARDAQARTPLHLATTLESGCGVVACSLLVQAGADTEATRPDGSTPLLLAAQQGKGEIICALIQGGASVAESDGAGHKTNALFVLLRSERLRLKQAGLRASAPMTVPALVAFKAMVMAGAWLGDAPPDVARLYESTLERISTLQGGMLRVGRQASTSMFSSKTRLVWEDRWVEMQLVPRLGPATAQLCIFEAREGQEQQKKLRQLGLSAEPGLAARSTEAEDDDDDEGEHLHAEEHHDKGLFAFDLDVIPSARDRARVGEDLQFLLNAEVLADAIVGNEAEIRLTRRYRSSSRGDSGVVLRLRHPMAWADMSGLGKWLDGLKHATTHHETLLARTASRIEKVKCRKVLEKHLRARQLEAASEHRHIHHENFKGQNFKPVVPPKPKRHRSSASREPSRRRTSRRPTRHAPAPPRSKKKRAAPAIPKRKKKKAAAVMVMAVEDMTAGDFTSMGTAGREQELSDAGGELLREALAAGFTG